MQKTIEQALAGDPLLPSATSYKKWLFERLLESRYACSYLRAHMTPQDGAVDKKLLAVALRDIAEAHGLKAELSEKK